MKQTARHPVWDRRGLEGIEQAAFVVPQVIKIQCIGATWRERRAGAPVIAVLNLHQACDEILGLALNLHHLLRLAGREPNQDGAGSVALDGGDKLRIDPDQAADIELACDEFHEPPLPSHPFLQRKITASMSIGDL